tara:strand:+ start:1155 stop:1934 length:780 start_codon:yes stop_codon:yes gene_type:complete
MELQNIVVEKNDKVALVKFNRPKALNALNSETLGELNTVVDALSNDEDIRVVVFTGEGKSFIAGADIGEMSTLSAEEGRKFGALGQSVFRKVELMSKPTIAAVNGFALGGGCEFAMSCDIRIASEKAKFGQPEVTLGITPGFSGTVRLPKLVGMGKAKELIYTGRMVKADEALSIGLVNQVASVDSLMEEAMKMAQTIAGNAPLAVSYSKAAINKGAELDTDVANTIEETYFGLSFATEDQKDGMSAFLNKEKAAFKGK